MEAKDLRIGNLVNENGEVTEIALPDFYKQNLYFALTGKELEIK